MSDEREYFERLTEILRRHGFGWVVAQAQAEIAGGRAVTKEVRAPDIKQALEPDSFVRQTPRRRRAALVATEPYGPNEQLSILIRGIEAAIIDRAALEEAVLETIGDVSGIEFLPDESEVIPLADGARSHRLERGRLNRGSRVSHDLSEALRRLREITDGRA